MSKVISLKGLPDNMIRRLLKKEVSDSELAYAGVMTVLLIPIEEGGTLIVFDTKKEWNDISDLNIENLFGLMAGN